MLKDLLKRSRSYRSFRQDLLIPEEKLIEWIDGTRYTPAAMNKQPLKYKIISQKADVERIRPLTKWAAALPDIIIPPEGHHATAFIIILMDKSIVSNKEPFLKDVGICAQTILLQAVECEFGGCMIGNFSPEKVRTAFDIAETLEPVLIIGFGKPDEEITLTEVTSAGSTKYYRDSEGHHFVPKRMLEEILV